MTDYAVINPATGERVAGYPGDSDDQLAAAIDAADDAYHGWGRTTTVDDRAALLRSVAEEHRRRREELARIIVREMGKPITQALDEVDFSAAIYRYYADHGPDFIADEPIDLLDGSGSAWIRTSGIGVLLGIMPWNFPYYQVARFAAPNLLLGNTILLKHAPQCPESATAIAELITAAGFPSGAYRTIYAGNEQIADLIADPRLHGVSLTGSERAGAAVAEIAGRQLTKVVLELGGSDPFILLSTDDLDACVDAAVAGRLDNSGQACNAAKRFIVTDQLYDAFLDRFITALDSIEPRDPLAEDTVLGPLSSDAAADRLQAQVERAVAGGATRVLGGPRHGAFFPATVLTDVTADNPAYAEELFGPVAVVHRVSGEEDAVRLANDTRFGLGCYLFSTDPEQAVRVADRIEAGMVFINAVGAEGPELPFGGVKRSGFGRELGRYGIGEFANRKLIRVAG